MACKQAEEELPKQAAEQALSALAGLVAPCACRHSYAEALKAQARKIKEAPPSSKAKEEHGMARGRSRLGGKQPESLLPLDDGIANDLPPK